MNTLVAENVDEANDTSAKSTGVLLSVPATSTDGLPLDCEKTLHGMGLIQRLKMLTHRASPTRIGPPLKRPGEDWGARRVLIGLKVARRGDHQAG
jgi:hypothetical protein